MLFYDRDVGTVVFYDLAPFFGFIVNDRVSLTEFPFPKKKKKKRKNQRTSCSFEPESPLFILHDIKFVNGFQFSGAEVVRLTAEFNCQRASRAKTVGLRGGQLNATRSIAAGRKFTIVL